jgi:lambda family phage portal protein
MGRAADQRHQEKREARLRELAAAEGRGAGIGSGLRTGHPKAGYEAVDTAKARRSVVQVSTKAEENELRQYDRRTLTSTARDVQRNMALAAWAIRKHLDYVARFTFQSRTGNSDFDRLLEARMAEWGQARNCDAGKRHSLARQIRLLEQCAIVDGDCGLVRLASGRLQLIEGDRICEAEGLPDRPARFSQGVEYDAAGAPVRYAIARRGENSGLQFDSWIPAEWLTLRGYFHRADQVRGVTPLSAGLNSLRDLHDNFELCLVKAKLHNVFGMAIVRQAVAGIEDGMAHLDAETGDDPDEDTTKYKVDLAGGPFKVELEPGEDIKFLESQVPSDQFRQFSELMIRSALLCCDIPYTMFDVKGSTYSGARQDLLQYYRSAEVKRESLAEILDEITAWQVSRWVAQGSLVLPGRATMADLAWEWIGAGQPWIDPLKEIEAQRLAVEAGFSSTPRVCREHGVDAYEIATEEAQYLAARKALGLPDRAPRPEQAPASAAADEPQPQEAALAS